MSIRITRVLITISLIGAAVLPAQAQRRLPGQLPNAALANARVVGPTAADEPISIALALPLRNQADLNDLLQRLYDPASPFYGHFLTSDEFTQEFGPTPQDYEAVASFAVSHGLAIIGTHANRTLLDVAGPASVIEQAFGVQLMRYQAADGRIFRAPTSDPVVPDALAGRLTGVIGLDNAAVRRPHLRPLSNESAAPLQVGNGPGGALTPANIKSIYNLNATTANGSRQTLGLFELDGYRSSDIAAYESYYKLPAVPLQNVLVDGYSGAAGTGATEVTLDIELQAALAPGASKILVYEGPNSGAGVVDTYNRIATDNLAKEISTSWGLSETSSSYATLNSESAAFQQMAAQGQSIFAAAGDSGAYDNGSTLSVDDPASQPYMVGVGGTTLSVLTGELYGSEGTWNGGSIRNGAGGGGISSVWSIPTWQQGVVSPASKGSTLYRNVPDVSLDADPNTGYSIYYSGGWYIYGGTSCAAPLWSAFTAIVNQQRLANGGSLLGFANPLLYSDAESARYTTDFHDVSNGSTNLYYPAVTGYDDATGWGSFNGANLLADLSGSPVAPVAPAAPTNLSATAGNATVSLSWTGSAGATGYNVKRSTTSGSGYSTIASGISGSSYTDNSVANGVTYYYVVTAVNSVGESPNSNEVSATPVAVSPPAAPTGLTAAAVSRSQINLKWINNATNATSILVERSTNGLSFTQIASLSGTAVSYSSGGLARSTTYYYRVRASNGGGDSAYSNIASARTPKH